jgi:hypothetical protein
MKPKLILDLCGGTGAWSRPYAEDSNYEVLIIDPLKGTGDVRLLRNYYKNVHGILAAPPCTHLAGSGARWWKAKGDEALLEALSVVDACMRQIYLHPEVKWWCLENPVGRLNKFLSNPKNYYNPCQYARWSDNPNDESYTKYTGLWGRFNMPVPKGLTPVLGSKLHLLPPSKDRAMLRSITPQGFARAFKDANL